MQLSSLDHVEVGDLIAFLPDTLTSRRPTCSISTITRSPSMIGPTPAGVPVVTMSPG